MQKERLSNIFIGVLVTLVIILSAVRIIIANQLVGASEKLKNLDQQVLAMERQNATLAQDLRQKESYQALLDRAVAAGFVPADKYSLVKVDKPVAFGLTADSLQ